MSSVESWFGEGFHRLHPTLQALHREGGRLAGVVRFRPGRGVAGVIGRRAMRRLGIDPANPEQALVVDIRHEAGALRWSRRFGNAPEAVSWFRPVGHWPDGHWEERAGALTLQLAVETDGGGWQWRQIGCRYLGVPMPNGLAPRVEAGKRIDPEGYRFDVAIHLPVIGEMLAWGGTLRMAC